MVTSHLHRIFTPSVRVHWCIYAHICMSHGTHMYESCHAYGHVSFWTRSCFALTLRARVCWYAYTYTYAWVTAHIWMSHITPMNDSYHTYEWVISLIWMSYITHMNESYHTYEWVTSHIWMSHIINMFMSCFERSYILSSPQARVYIHRCAAVSCSVLQQFKMFFLSYLSINKTINNLFIVAALLKICCSVLQCVAVCCSVLQCVAVCCSVLQCLQTI